MKRTNESGRSMVEMLGVLAIIGVLSVGGIMGYARAMQTWKANEVIEACNRLIVVSETDYEVTTSQTYSDAGFDVNKIAGGIVKDITFYPATSTTTAKAQSVEVQFNTGVDNAGATDANVSKPLATAICEKIENTGTLSGYKLTVNGKVCTKKATATP